MTGKMFTCKKIIKKKIDNFQPNLEQAQPLDDNLDIKAQRISSLEASINQIKERINEIKERKQNYENHKKALESVSVNKTPENEKLFMQIDTTIAQNNEAINISLKEIETLETHIKQYKEPFENLVLESPNNMINAFQDNTLCKDHNINYFLSTQKKESFDKIFEKCRELVLNHPTKSTEVDIICSNALKNVNEASIDVNNKLLAYNNCNQGLNIENFSFGSIVSGIGAAVGKSGANAAADAAAKIAAKNIAAASAKTIADAAAAAVGKNVAGAVANVAAKGAGGAVANVAAKGAGDAAANVAAKGAGGAVAKNAGDVAGAAGAAGGAAAKNAGDVAGAAGGAAAKNAGDLAAGAGKAGGKAADDVVGAGGKAVDDIAGAGGKAGSSAADVLRAAGASVGRFALRHPLLVAAGLTAAGLAIYAAAKGISFDQAAEELKDKTVDELKEIVEDVKPLAEELGGLAGDVISEVVQPIAAPIVDAGADLAGDILTPIMENAGDLISKVFTAIFGPNAGSYLMYGGIVFVLIIIFMIFR